jgi:hypothetical protein
LPVHQDVEIGGALLAIRDSFALTQPMKAHDRDIADNADRGILVFVDERSSIYLVHRSNAAPSALSAFLDVSSLNLAVPQSAAIFLLGASPGSRISQ